MKPAGPETDPSLAEETVDSFLQPFQRVVKLGARTGDGHSQEIGAVAAVPAARRQQQA